MKKSLKLSFCLCAVLGLSSCSSYNTLQDVQESGVLVVATNAEFAPFEYIEDGNYVGFDMDLIKEYANYIGVECQIIHQDFDAALLSVSNGKADVAIAAITKNEKREQSMSFSNTYYTANQVCIVKKDSVYASITEEETLLSTLSANKAKIGFQTGTTGEYYTAGDADWGYEGISNSVATGFANGGLAVSSLVNGQIDAVIIDIEPAKVLCANNDSVTYLNIILTQEEYAIATAKGNDSLILSINDFISYAKENEIYETIISKYFN